MLYGNTKCINEFDGDNLIYFRLYFLSYYLDDIILTRKKLADSMDAQLICALLNICSRGNNTLEQIWHTNVVMF